MNSDTSQHLQQQIHQACKQQKALSIVGGNSKAFYGRVDERIESAEKLNVSAHRGVLSYEPTELVITARAGTPLAEIEKLLDDNGQMLPFEPSSFSDTATIGGTIACNLSGPRRAYAGAARDLLLGCKIINGKGEMMSFGGEVMKNVAGYDVSRLMAGAMGTLGVLLEVSLKVLPQAEKEVTQLFQYSHSEALDKIHTWSQTPLPISASSYHDSILRVRFSGAAKAVNAAIDYVGGETIADQSPAEDRQYWQSLKDQQLDFFTGDQATTKPLWRISMASDIESLDLPADYANDDCLYEWGGALRWLKSDAPVEVMQSAASAVDGHASLFRHPQGSIFQPLTPGLLRIHKNLKQAFDPENILNPGKLYPEL